MMKYILQMVEIEINNIPEMSVDGVKFLFGVGGEDKKNSSSWILKKWNQETIERSWGKYIILLKDHGVVVKELVLFSLIRHEFPKAFS